MPLEVLRQITELSRRLAVIALVVITMTIGGCSRKFWRQQADRDAYALVNEKRNNPAWNVPRIDIAADPRSRFHEPYDLDRGPLPPDDPAAGEYMLCVAGKQGYKSWHKFGEAFSIENPHWLSDMGVTPEVIQQASFNGEPSSIDRLPTLNGLTLKQALELSNIHSRNYQTEIENVYLRALELSFERFQFDVRYLGLGGRRPTVDATHTSVPGTTDSVNLGSRFGISQMLPSGGQWIVELANQTVWLFSGPNSVSSASTISYSLVQPLMFQAGRKIALERLTQSERNLLYVTRDLARFRKEFFTGVVGGTSGYLSVLGLQQRVANERGNIRRNEEQLKVLTVLASQVSIEFHEDLPALPNNGQLLDDPPAMVKNQIRYNEIEKRLYWRGFMSPAQKTTLDTMSADPGWRNAVALLKQQRVYESLDALPPGIQIPPEVALQLTYNPVEKRLYWSGQMIEGQEKILLALDAGAGWQKAIAGLIIRLRFDVLTRDILQLQNSLLRSRNQLRGTERSFENLLDQFKLQLGLPPNMPINLDATLLQQFELIDKRVSATEQALKNFVLEWAKLDDTDPDLDQLRGVVSGLDQLRTRIQRDVFDVIDADMARLKRDLPDFLSKLQDESQRDRVRRDTARDEVLLRSTRSDFLQTSRRLAQLSSDFSSLKISTNDALNAGAVAGLGAALGRELVLIRKTAAVKLIAILRESFLKITQNAQVIQIGLRVEQIPLEQFTLSMLQSEQQALANRLDLKNARAAVMDARRRVEVMANRLESVLNLKIEGDIRTRPGDNKPLDFRGRNSNFRVGVGFTAPLDQVNARNAYRDAQIDYQRARRAYMAIEDQIKLSVRSSWRNLAVLRSNFETARQQVRISALQFDSTVEAALAPGPVGGRSSGLDLLNALANVLNAQNSLIGIWVNYEQSRLNIHRDTGIMKIDALGVWNDDYYQTRFPANTVAPPPPTPAEGRAPNDTIARTASKPTLHRLKRISGSVRVRNGGERHVGRLRFDAGDAKPPTPSPREPSRFLEHAEAVDARDVSGRSAGRRRVRVSDSP